MFFFKQILTDPNISGSFSSRLLKVSCPLPFQPAKVPKEPASLAPSKFPDFFDFFLGVHLTRHCGDSLGCSSLTPSSALKTSSSITVVTGKTSYSIHIPTLSLLFINSFFSWLRKVQLNLRPTCHNQQRRQSKPRSHHHRLHFFLAFACLGNQPTSASHCFGSVVETGCLSDYTNTKATEPRYKVCPKDRCVSSHNAREVIYSTPRHRQTAKASTGRRAKEALFCYSRVFGIIRLVTEER